MPLESAVPLGLALTLFVFALGSASIVRLLEPARLARWFVLSALVLLLAAAVRSAGARLPRFGVPGLAVGLLLGLAFLSAAWSVRPWLTFQRTVALALALAAAAGLAALVRHDERWLRRVAVGLVTGGAAVAAAGGILYLVAQGTAVQEATLTAPARFNGLGQNPNTAPLLLSFLCPLGAWLAATARGPARVVWVLVTLGFLATIFGSDSRGAEVAGAASLLVLACVALTGVRRFLALAAVVALFVAGVAGRTLLHPATDLPQVSGVPYTPDPTLLGYVSPLQPVDPNEVGRPAPGLSAAPGKRTLLGSSGRAVAWDGAFHQALQRPILGYGFGTEDKVFVDRYFYFQGDRPENAYLGLLLQNGVAGLLLYLVFAGALLLGVARALRRGLPRTGAVTAFSCVVVAGLVMGLVQSFVYSVGNIGTLTFWVAAALVAASTAQVPRHA
jgi:hypothetical protein